MIDPIERLYARANNTLIAHRFEGLRYWLGASGLQFRSASDLKLSILPMHTTHANPDMRIRRRFFWRSGLDGPWHLIRKAILIGRHPQSAIRLKHHSVSNFHAMLVPQSHGLRVVDLGSTNGCRIGKKRFNDVLLQEDTELQIGSTTVNIGARRNIHLSPHLYSIYNQARKALRHELPLWISGAPGTGKSQLLRRLSSDLCLEGNTVVSHSAELSHLEGGMLSGHRAGAFTGAVRDFDGLAVSAHRGILAIDPADGLHPSIQVAMLRILEEGSVRPIGSHETKPCRFRLIMVGHTMPAELLQQNTLREDFYYRTCGVHLRLPSIAERPEILSDFLGSHPEASPEIEKSIKLPLRGNFHEVMAKLNQGAFETIGSLQR